MSATILRAPASAEITERLNAAAGPDRQPAADMAELAARLRALLDVEAQQETRLRLGGALFEIVITGADQAAEALERMDVQQGGCGPVIQDPAGWLYWLVPPGTRRRWAWHPYAVCLGEPYNPTLPPLNRDAPPGPYWLRPPRSDAGPGRSAAAGSDAGPARAGPAPRARRSPRFRPLTPCSSAPVPRMSASTG
ncbi:hypothetical protein [Streptomyces sp. NBC_00209]|uniref:hypothetical protein n=1 Tax=Streptomyces sp. NBC_00209 TaxID=2975682 RepID=UPI003244D3BE